MSKYLNTLNEICNDVVEDLDIFLFELDDFQKHDAQNLSRRKCLSYC